MAGSENGFIVEWCDGAAMSVLEEIASGIARLPEYADLSRSDGWSDHGASRVLRDYSRDDEHGTLYACTEWSDFHPTAGNGAYTVYAAVKSTSHKDCCAWPNYGDYLFVYPKTPTDDDAVARECYEVMRSEWEKRFGE